MRKQSKMPRICIILLFSVLAACGADVDREVTFYSNEAWQTSMELSTSASTLALMGAAPGDLESAIEEAVNAYEERGADMSWRSRSDGDMLIYTVEAKGTGWELLNDLAFEGRATISEVEGDDEDKIYFAYSGSGDLAGAENSILTLNGGEVLSSNGDEIGTGQVQWINPLGGMEAVLTPKSGFDLVTLLLVGLAVAAIGAGIWFLVQYNKKTSTPPVPELALPQSSFCMYCGTPLSPNAKFCHKCGKKQ